MQALPLYDHRLEHAIYCGICFYTNDQAARMRILVSPMDFTDWHGLLRLLRDSFAFMDARIDPPSSLKRMGIEELSAKAAEETLVIATDGQELIGCVFAAVREDCVYVGKVAVASAARRQSVARALMNTTENLAREHNRSCLELETRIELVENHAPFQALGFTKVAETAHPGYSRPTSITMRRRVAENAANMSLNLSSYGSPKPPV